MLAVWALRVRTGRALAIWALWPVAIRMLRPVAVWALWPVTVGVLSRSVTLFLIGPVRFVRISAGLTLATVEIRGRAVCRSGSFSWSKFTTVLRILFHYFNLKM